MSQYKEFAFRALDVQTFLEDVKQVCADNGIDGSQIDSPARTW